MPAPGCRPPAPTLRRHRLGGWLLLLAVGLGAAAGAEDRQADRVILLANTQYEGSVRIARHYATVRGVPADNLIALPMPQSEVITWHEFVSSVWVPLLENLIRRGWIDAIPMALTDRVGRRKFAPQGHRLAALVVCRGVPLRIAHDPTLYSAVLPLTNRAEFRTNGGAVDAELSLLAQPNYPINAFVPNLLFQDERPTALELAQVVKVARLDGPTVRAALKLVDQAVAAEAAGLLGRAYVDIGDRDRVGNGWLEATARQLDNLGFSLTVDRAPATLPTSSRFDAPVLYFGWYAANLEGPFVLPGFRFPPGAIALHIHSYSATTLRSPTSGWAGPFVARGVTATVGNVAEPYLHLTHRPNLLLRALSKGQTLADAAYFALPGLSWQAILIGDPLYRPFAISLTEQLKRRDTFPPRLAGYAVLRRMRQLDELGHADDATALAVSTQREAPSLAVGLALGQRLLAAGDPEAAAAGRSVRALEVWRNLFALPDLTRELRLAWLGDAIETARVARDVPQAAAWQPELDELVSTGPQSTRL